MKGKRALIIGGSSGIGLATVKKLASHGCNLCIVHRDRKQGVIALEEV
ncbi:MAG: SDR family NAD(P)-dependent oxidoreductase, partial [Ekhidna sp.]|nr:SDR family NAD(P)-dependent oxidoreductase [Ekhidna sp.]